MVLTFRIRFVLKSNDDKLPVRLLCLFLRLSSLFMCLSSVPVFYFYRPIHSYLALLPFSPCSFSLISRIRVSPFFYPFNPPLSLLPFSLVCHFLPFCLSSPRLIPYFPPLCHSLRFFCYRLGRCRCYRASAADGDGD
jgi:hypothetical protein